MKKDDEHTRQLSIVPKGSSNKPDILSLAEFEQIITNHIRNSPTGNNVENQIRYISSLYEILHNLLQDYDRTTSFTVSHQAFIAFIHYMTTFSERTVFLEPAWLSYWEMFTTYFTMYMYADPNETESSHNESSSPETIVQLHDPFSRSNVEASVVFFSNLLLKEYAYLVNRLLENLLDVFDSFSLEELLEVKELISAFFQSLGPKANNPRALLQWKQKVASMDEGKKKRFTSLLSAVQTLAQLSGHTIVIEFMNILSAVRTEKIRNQL